jgi:cell division protein FtsX
MPNTSEIETFLQTDIDEPNQPKIKAKLAEFKSLKFIRYLLIYQSLIE